MSPFTKSQTNIGVYANMSTSSVCASKCGESCIKRQNKIVKMTKKPYRQIGGDTYIKTTGIHFFVIFPSHFKGSLALHNA